MATSATNTSCRLREYREKIIEAAAEYDDEVMEAYLSEMPIDPQKILDAIRRATINLELVPVLCGSALKNKGIQPLLDAIAKFLPSPVDVPPIKGTHPETGDIIECKARESDPLAALIFKVSMMEGRKLSFVRVYSGRMKAGEDVYNPSLQKKGEAGSHFTDARQQAGACRHHWGGQHCGNCRLEGFLHR